MKHQGQRIAETAEAGGVGSAADTTNTMDTTNTLEATNAGNAGNAARVLMSGNQAIARGAYEAGVGVACAYPGTPSTEILEHMRAFKGIYVEWSPNEKVALEVALGAAVAGVRALAAMKHVGLNVAADPLFTAAYTGVNAGLVIVSADDPGMHSSQNEQDSRHYARSAKIPMLEPSDSQEAKGFVGLALDISERFDTPVMLRTTTRVSHSSGVVALGAPQALRRLPYKKNPPKYVMVPGHARLRRIEVEARLKALADFAEDFAHNTIEWNSSRVGIIASGVSYQYAREVLGENASYLKLALTNPIPEGVIRRFAARVDRLYVVEDLDPFLEDHIRALGIRVTGKSPRPSTGELTPEMIRRAMAAEGVLDRAGAGIYALGGREGGADRDSSGTGAPATGGGESRPAALVTNESAGVESPGAGCDGRDAVESTFVPARPPVMCAGCPHRGTFYVLRKLKTVATGDIGCYTLGVAPPLSALDTTICMGASIGNAIGFAAAAAAMAAGASTSAATAAAAGATGEPATAATARAADPTVMTVSPASGADGNDADGKATRFDARVTTGAPDTATDAAIPRKPVAVIGDSTFVHSGITGLVDAVYNRASIVILILDNGTTAMTGHQNHPATGVTLRGTPTHRLSLEDLARACGVEHVAVVDPYDLAATERVLRQAMDAPGPAVVVARRECVLLPGARRSDRYTIRDDRCTACKLCLGLGCPAIEARDGRPVIISGSCTGCGVCAQVCRFDAIALQKAGGDHE